MRTWKDERLVDYEMFIGLFLLLQMRKKVRSVGQMEMRTEGAARVTEKRKGENTGSPMNTVLIKVWRLFMLKIPYALMFLDQFFCVHEARIISYRISMVQSW